MADVIGEREGVDKRLRGFQFGLKHIAWVSEVMRRRRRYVTE